MVLWKGKFILLCGAVEGVSREKESAGTKRRVLRGYENIKSPTETTLSNFITIFIISYFIRLIFNK